MITFFKIAPIALCLLAIPLAWEHSPARANRLKNLTTNLLVILIILSVLLSFRILGLLDGKDAVHKPWVGLVLGMITIALGLAAYIGALYKGGSPISFFRPFMVALAAASMSLHLTIWLLLIFSSFIGKHPLASEFIISGAQMACLLLGYVLMRRQGGPEESLGLGAMAVFFAAIMTAMRTMTLPEAPQILLGAGYALSLFFLSLLFTKALTYASAARALASISILLLSLAAFWGLMSLASYLLQNDRAYYLAALAILTGAIQVISGNRRRYQVA